MNKKIFLTGFIMLWTVSLYAGIASLNFLNRDYNAAYSGSAGAVSGVAGDGGDAIAIYNPAGILSGRQTEASVSYMSYIQGISYSMLSFAKNSKGGQLGLGSSIVYADYGSMAGEKEDASGGYADGSSYTYNDRDMMFLLTGAKALGSRLSFGINAKYVLQKYDTYQSQWFLADLGARYLMGNAGLGISLNNMGVNLTAFDTKKEKAPMNVRLSGGLVIMNDKLKVGSDVIIPFSDSIKAGVGAEYRLLDYVFIRAGYKYEKQDLGALAGLRTGFGVKLKAFVIDYSFQPFSKLGNVHQVSIAYRR